MVIISEYSLSNKEKNGFFTVIPEKKEIIPCPLCRGRLEYRDSRPRIQRFEGGEKRYLLIRRLRCTDCRRYHNELPDCLAPHKHYGTETVSGVLDDVISPEDADSADYPCEQTMKRWKHWFMLNRLNMEGQLRETGHTILGLGKTVLQASESILECLRSHLDQWLECVLRIIYNSGGFLPSGHQIICT